VLAQRTGESGAGIHLGAQGGHQVALAVIVGLVREGAQGALQRQARTYQPGDLPRPDGQAGGVEHRPGEQAAVPALGSTVPGVPSLDLLHCNRHQGLRTQLGAGGLGGVGLHQAFAGLALGVQGFKGKSGHAAGGGWAVAKCTNAPSSARW